MLSHHLLPLVLTCNLIFTIPFSVATAVPYLSKSREDVSYHKSRTDRDSNICKFDQNHVSERSGNNRLPD